MIHFLLQSEYGISKTSFYQIMRDRESFSNPDNIRGVKSRKDLTGPKIELDNRLIDWIESEKRQVCSLTHFITIFW